MNDSTARQAGNHDAQPIAVIGMSGRFPGADDVDEFWDNLSANVESFVTFTDDELRAAGVDQALIEDPNYVRSRPVLRDVRSFDATFFGMSPREATSTDPQQRLFTECAWESLESAGYGNSQGRGPVGIFAGTNFSSYLITRPRALGIGGGEADELMASNDKDALATRVSYRFDLRGPSVAVQSFCSTSLVAVHLACSSLRQGECDIALAGGVSLRLPDRVGYLYREGDQVSPDGHVRTFDAKARGSMLGDGVAVVALKRLDEAIADRDTILTVIRGSAINNDGGLKFSYQAPSIEGQRRCVTDALANAGVEASDLSYVEAHGTATEVGDPMEVAALTSAFGAQDSRQHCLLGSVKTNVGHLDRASGVTGLIKVIQSLRHELIPGTLHFESPNPEIDFATSPFKVTPTTTDWPHDPARPRIAGVSSLGMGGTNCHVVVTEAPNPPERPPRPTRWEILPVSARSSDSADRACKNLAESLSAAPAPDLGDVAHTLQAGRARFEHRRVVIADSTGSASAQLESPTARLSRLDATVGRKVGFVFAGVGEQYPGMAADLYANDADFRTDVDECVDILGLSTAADLSSLFTQTEQSAAVNALAVSLGRVDPLADDTDDAPDALVQPAMFVAEYAVAQYLMRRGIRPEIMVGYSVGEYVAACVSGVLDLPEALSLVARRAELIARLPRGAMLAVGADEPTVAKLLSDMWGDIDVAIRTGSQLVLAASEDTIVAASILLLADGIACRQLATSHAYHSRMLAAASAELTEWVADNVTVRPPQIPYVSNVTGELITNELVSDPSYWARHMCETVEFGAALNVMLARADRALVEIGPGQSLGAMVRAHPACDRDRWPLIVSTIPGVEHSEDTERSLAETISRLWLAGVDVDWGACHGGWEPGRVPLPTYSFDRREYWLDEDVQTFNGYADFDPEDPTGQLSALPTLEEPQLVNLPVWQKTAPRPRAALANHLVVFARPGLHDTLVAHLRLALCAESATLTVVAPGEGYAVERAADATRVTVRPGSVDDITAMLADFAEREVGLDRVIHLWEANPLDSHAEPRVMSEARQSVERGLHTLVAFARAANERGYENWALDIVTTGAQSALLGDRVQPHRATLLGPCRLIPVEYPTIRTRMVDVDSFDTEAHEAALNDELRTEPVDQVVALRGRERWIPGYEVIPPEADPSAGARFREGGTYLVTGGLGGIGLAMAERIAEDYGANVLLVGRTPVPPREHWASMLDDPSTSDEVRRRLRGLRRLEAGRGAVSTVAADISSPNDARRAVEAAIEEFGELHGILHCAGVPAVGLMQFKSSHEMDAVLAPKLDGGFALANAVGDRDLDFLVVFSSTTSATGGGAGQVDYCAANAAADAFALSDPIPGCHVASIGWGEWTWNGWTAGLERYDEGSRQFLEQYRERHGIDFDTGWRVLQRVLAAGLPYTIISTQDFPTLVQISRESTISSHLATVREVRDQLGRHPRPDLATAYVEPQTEAEVAIAGVWADALGLEDVGTQDNFFNLGGNSLIGMEVIAHVRTALDLDYLAPHLLYQAPTVSALASAAQPDDQGAQAEWDELRSERQTRIELRRSSLQARRTV